MTIRTASGAVVPGCISSLSGEAPLDEYRTMVFYHENNPNWHEIVKVRVLLSSFFFLGFSDERVLGQHGR